MWTVLGVKICVFFMLAILVNGQNASQNCADMIGMPNPPNYSLFTGIWWEVARNPKPKGTYDCVMVNLTMLQDNILYIETTFSNSPNMLWYYETMYTNIELPPVEEYNIGFNISYKNNEYTVYKLLTAAASVVLFCGYTNASDPSTSFGMVLTRDRYPGNLTLNSYESVGFDLKYPYFLNGSMPTILQSPTCTGSGALALYSIGFTVFAALYVSIQLVL